MRNGRSSATLEYRTFNSNITSILDIIVSVMLVRGRERREIDMWSTSAHGYKCRAGQTGTIVTQGRAETAAGDMSRTGAGSDWVREWTVEVGGDRRGRWV